MGFPPRPRRFSYEVSTAGFDSHGPTLKSSSPGSACRVVVRTGGVERFSRRVYQRQRGQPPYCTPSADKAQQSHQRNQAGASKKISASRKGVRPDHGTGRQKHPTDKKRKRASKQERSTTIAYKECLSSIKNARRLPE